MQVFKTFLKIAKKKIPVAFIYIGVFFAISFIMASNSNSNTDFKDTKLDVCVMDEDNTPASKALTDYIAKTHKLVTIDNNKDDILDAIYYERVDYVLTIKEGYAQKLAEGNTNDLFTNYKIPGSYTATFFDSVIDSYVCTLNAYLTSGEDFDQAQKSTVSALNEKVKVDKTDFSATTNSEYSEDFSYYFQYLPYIFLSILISALCPILLIMNSKEVRNRTNCSAISSTSQTVQILLGSGLFVLATWLLFMAAAFLLYNQSINTTILMAVLNSFVFMLVSAGIAVLIATLSPGEKALSMIANIVGLGMSFLCGIFVPQSMLGDGVLNAAKFLPAYWYVKANNMLAGIGEVYSKDKYITYIGIQLLFAVALFAVILLFARLKRQNKAV